MNDRRKGTSTGRSGGSLLPDRPVRANIPPGDKCRRSRKIPKRLKNLKLPFDPHPTMGTATAQSEPAAADTRSGLSSVRAAAWVKSFCHPALLFPGNPQFVIYQSHMSVICGTEHWDRTCDMSRSLRRWTPVIWWRASGRNDPQLPVSSTLSHHVGFNAFTLSIRSFCLFASRRFNDVSLTGNMGNVCVLVQFLLYFASFSTASHLRKGELVVFMH